MSLLMLTLEVAVPMHIEEIRDWTDDQRIAYARQHADTVASRGDDLQYGAKKKGETARLFNTLARCLACLAYQPGGVTFHGIHWNATTLDGQ